MYIWQSCMGCPPDWAERVHWEATPPVLGVRSTAYRCVVAEGIEGRTLLFPVLMAIPDGRYPDARSWHHRRSPRLEVAGVGQVGSPQQPAGRHVQHLVLQRDELEVYARCRDPELPPCIRDSMPSVSSPPRFQARRISRIFLLLWVSEHSCQSCACSQTDADVW